MVGTFGAFQPGPLGVSLGLFHQQGVASGQGLDLVLGQGGGADVLDFTDVQAAAWPGDEPGLPLDGLPHIGHSTVDGFVRSFAAAHLYWPGVAPIP